MRCKSWQRSCGWRRVAESRLEYPNRFTHVNSKNPQINLLSLKPWNAHSLIKSLKSSRILFPPLPSHNPSPLQLSSQSHTIVLHPCADGVHWETEEKSGADHCNAGHPSWLYLYVQFVYIFKRAPFTWALVFGCEVCTHPQHRCNHVNVYACITLRVLCMCVCVCERWPALPQTICQGQTPKPLQLCTMTFKWISFHLHQTRPNCAFLIPCVFMQETA